MTPIVQSASFAFEDSEDLAVALAKPGTHFAYSRVGNPTVDALERTIADLEDAEAGIASGSGMAAIHAAILAFCSAGDHIVAPASLYGGTFSLFKNVLARLGIESTFVDGYDLAAVEKAAAKPRTKVVYAETIANPALGVADLPELARIAHAAGARLVVDNTFASPALCRPCAHGADVSLHSATKYLGGHGDLIAGVAAGRSDAIDPIRKVVHQTGGILEPFTAFLLLRGVKTLPLRMERHSSNAARVAEFLAKNERVSKVIYPGLATHPHHALAKKLLATPGGMVGFEVPGGRAEGAKVLHALELFALAGSLGDVDSLALQPSTTSHRQLDAKELAAAGISEGYIRLSVGIEDAEDLIADLGKALRA